MDCGRLLIIEPQPLLRWSLTTYLGRWFDVSPTATVEAAREILQSEKVNALVFSDDLPADEKEEIRTLLALAENGPSIICTTTELGGTRGVLGGTRWASQDGIIRVEKPFELRRLAILLGVDEKCLSKTT